MKKFLLSAATAAAALTTLSADQFYVIMKDGSVESYPTEKVDSISFNDPQIAKIMGFNEMAAELIKLKERVAALEAKSGTVVDTSATSNASDLKYFVLNDKEVEVIGFVNGSADLVIPETALVNGKVYTVTSIAQEAFQNQNRIKTVLLPKTINYIGELAFDGCKSLTSIEIPSGVTSIAAKAFCACSSLKSINIPSSVTSIGYAAFEGCSGLTKLTVPSSVVSIGGDAFYACDNLDLIIDNSRSNVECGGSAFGRLKSLTFTGSPLLFRVLEDGSGVELTNSYGEGDDVYPSLKSVKIPSEVEINGKKYPVTSISRFAFAGCHNLTSIEIPSSVTSIGEYAFRGCKELDVVIDNSRSNVECRDVFNGVNSLTFTGSQFLFKVLEDGESAKIAYADYSGYKSIAIPSEAEINGKKYPVTAIGDSAFYHCSSLTSVIIPSSVTSIGYSAFYGCSSLAKLEIPSSVTSIKYNAFSDCVNLDVMIDNSRYNVEYEPTFHYVAFTGSLLLFKFDDSTNTASVTGFPSTASDGSHGDYYYGGLESIKIPSEIEKNGKVYNVTSIEPYTFSKCDNLISIDIPSSVTYIGGNAFFGCQNLNVVIDNSEENVELGTSIFNDYGVFDDVKSVKWLK